MLATQGTCEKCPIFVRPRLHHPEPLCPYRIGGPLNKSRRTAQSFQLSVKRQNPTLKINYKLNEKADFSPKICDLSNGVDIPFQKTVHLGPKEIKRVKLGISFQIPKNYCGLLFNKSSALLKYHVKVALGLIDQGFTKEIETVLENALDTEITLEKGIAVCQLLILPAQVPLLCNSWKNIGTNRGKFGSTGQDFVKTVNQNPIPLEKNSETHNFRSRRMPKNLRPRGPVDLLKWAEEANVSATAYMLRGGSNRKYLSQINPELRDDVGKKIYIEMYIKGRKIIACADSGSDLTLMQESLYKTAVNKYPLKNTLIECVTSYSSDSIKVLGEQMVYVQFSRKGPTVPLNITVISDIEGSTAPFLFGNDSFKTCLASLSYTGNREDPTPELIINNPVRTKPKIYYATPFETLTCHGQYDMEPF